MQQLNKEQDYQFQTAVIFSVLRMLKQINPFDTYYEAYLGHLRNAQARKVEFFDMYILLWEIGALIQPKRILEIGSRTGISLCQLLSAYIDQSVIEKIVSVDPHGDGFTSPALIQRNLKYLGLPWDKVQFCVEKSDTAMPRFIAEGDKFDLIIVDGDHAKQTAMSDLQFAADLIAPNGIIVFDDISPDGCDLLDVWEGWKGQLLNIEKFDLFEERLEGKGTAWAIAKEQI